MQTKVAATHHIHPSCKPASRCAQPACPTRRLFIRLRKPAKSSLMHPFQWCNGFFCGLGLVSTNKSCSMPPISFQDLPLNIYMVIFGTGIFVFMLSLIFCCYFIRWAACWLIWAWGSLGGGGRGSGELSEALVTESPASSRVSCFEDRTWSCPWLGP